MKKQWLFFLLLNLFALQVQAKSIPAPELSVINLTTSTSISLADYRGKVVYLDFWASWCPPCAQSFPKINQLYQELKQQGFEVIAVSVDEEKDDIAPFLKKHPVDFLIGWDNKGISPERFRVETMPTGYLIDKKGFIRHRFRGFHKGSEEKMKAAIVNLLNEKANS